MRLFDDPLYRRLPLLLQDQEAARILEVAVDELVSGIRTRDIDVPSAIDRVAAERSTYAACPCSVPADTPWLVAMSLLEARARGYLTDDARAVGERATVR